jgi:hypothetical protein
MQPPAMLPREKYTIRWPRASGSGVAAHLSSLALSLRERAEQPTFHRGEGRRYLCCYLSHSLLTPAASQSASERANARPAWNNDELTRSSQAKASAPKSGLRAPKNTLFSFGSFPWLESAQNLITKYFKRRRSVSFRVSLS